jgi:hypothetical protein
MLSYNSSLVGSSPFSDELRAEAQRRLSAGSPYRAYKGNAADVFQSFGSQAMANLDTAGAAANAAYASRLGNAQRQASLGGLQMLSAGQQNARNLASERLSGINGLLSGLFS